jgi:acetyl esterase/lipase
MAMSEITTNSDRDAGLCSTCLLAAALLIVATPHASAQVPPEVSERLRAIGRVIDPARTFAIYEPFHTEKEPYVGVKIVRDLKYGPDQRNALDVFMPANTNSGLRPVLMFLHGGLFVGGNKRVVPAIYDNIGVWAVRNGMIGVNIIYRLAPAYKWPTGAQDTAAAVKWLTDNIAAYGGDPSRIFLAGHSAGATHVADYITLPQFHPGPAGPGIKGAILISGIFDLARFPTDLAIRAYYGEDASKYAQRSPQAGLLTTAVPLILAYAELDPPEYATESKVLNEALCKVGRCPRLIEFAGHNHMSEIFSINTKDTQVSDVVLKFVKGLD